jgi:hypothetical protein
MTHVVEWSVREGAGWLTAHSRAELAEQQTHLIAVRAAPVERRRHEQLLQRRHGILRAPPHTSIIIRAREGRPSRRTGAGAPRDGGASTRRMHLPAQSHWLAPYAASARARRPRLVASAKKKVDTSPMRRLPRLREVQTRALDGGSRHSGSGSWRRGGSGDHRRRRRGGRRTLPWDLLGRPETWRTGSCR